MPRLIISSMYTCKNSRFKTTFRFFLTTYLKKLERSLFRELKTEIEQAFPWATPKALSTLREQLILIKIS